MHRQWLNISKITFIGVYLALIYSLQVALAPFPNIETVTLLFVIGAVELPIGFAFLLSFSFSFLEFLTYGPGDWMLLYGVVWPFLVLITSCLKVLIRRHWWLTVGIGTIFGFLFGTLDALIKGLLYGASGLMAYWIRGITFDLIHGVSNFLIFLLLYRPVHRIIQLYTNKFFAWQNDRQRISTLLLKCLRIK